MLYLSNKYTRNDVLHGLSQYSLKHMAVPVFGAQSTLYATLEGHFLPRPRGGDMLVNISYMSV